MVGMILVLILKFWSSTEILMTHLAVFVTIFGTIILGFADDMLDLPWRYKLLFPFFIVLPLITVYQGCTHI
jgi:UDP-N-acetylglucosamine--dolichyl-phosphate N-acetylglucosaminephosphotransferase